LYLYFCFKIVVYKHDWLSFTVPIITWLLIVTENLFHKWPRICSTCHKPVLFAFMIYHRLLTRVTRRVSLVEYELLTLLKPPTLSPLVLCFISRHRDVKTVVANEPVLFDMKYEIRCPGDLFTLYSVLLRSLVKTTDNNM
jgi:hypothetical protein